MYFKPGSSWVCLCEYEMLNQVGLMEVLKLESLVNCQLGVLLSFSPLVCLSYYTVIGHM